MNMPGKTPIEKIIPLSASRRSLRETLTPEIKTSRVFLPSSRANWGLRVSREGNDRPSLEENNRNNIKLNPYNCPDVSTHLSECPVCSNLYGKEKLLYIFLGAMIVIIFFVIKNQLN